MEAARIDFAGAPGQLRSDPADATVIDGDIGFFASRWTSVPPLTTVSATRCCRLVRT